MCQTTITYVNGTPTGTGSTLDLLVQGTSSSCKLIIVRVWCQGNWEISPIISVNTSTPGATWEYSFLGLLCLCGQEIEIEACCVDESGNYLQDCQCDTWEGNIPCDCCLDFDIQTQIGECDNQGKRQVTFNVSFVVNNASCLPYVVYMDFGNGNNSTPQVINSVGLQTLILTELYDTNIALNYTVTLHHTLHNNCPPQTLNLVLRPCPPIDCCPDVTAQINVKNCNDDCKREVEVITTFTPPNPNCPYASMQWEYYDSNNNFIQYGQSFNNLMPSPHIDTIFLSSSQSPVTAILKIANPPLDCPDIIETINIPDCDDCPDISSFTHVIKDCVRRADKCCRKVEFEIKGIFCANPKIRIDYGDGNYDEQYVPSNGMQTINFENEYCQGGNYTATLTILSPSGCPINTLNIVVPDCPPNECQDCCPVAVVDLERCISHYCNDDQTRDVEITANVVPTIKPNCPSNITAEMYIDGVLVDNNSGTTPFTLTHNGKYSCLRHQIEIKYPDFDCPSDNFTFCVSVCEKIGWIINRNLFSLFAGIALMSILLFIFNSSDSWLGILAGAAVIASIIQFIIWGGRKNICNRCPLKLATWMFLAIGFISFLWLSKSSFVVIIAWLTGIVGPFFAVLILILIILIILFLIYLLYLRWKNQCCPSCKDVWINFGIVVSSIITIVGLVNYLMNTIDNTGSLWEKYEQKFLTMNYEFLMGLIGLFIIGKIIQCWSEENCSKI